MSQEVAGNRIGGGEKKKKKLHKAPHRSFLVMLLPHNHPASVLQRWLNAFCVPLKTLNTASIIFLLFQCLAQMQNSMFCRPAGVREAVAALSECPPPPPAAPGLAVPAHPTLSGRDRKFWEQTLFVLQEVKATIPGGCLHNLLL